MSFVTPRRLPWLLGLSMLILAADRLTKNWVESHVPFGGGLPVMLSGLFGVVGLGLLRRRRRA